MSKMKVLLVSDCSELDASAGGRMMHELNAYLSKYHDVSVMGGGDKNFSYGNINIIKLKKPKSNIKRFFAELRFALDLIKNRDHTVKIDAVFWYSPSIFLAIFVGWCFPNSRKIMLLRDLFPLWLEQDLNLKFGITRFVLRLFEKYQYFIADEILVQSPGDLGQLKHRNVRKRMQVIRNWYHPRDIEEYDLVKRSEVTPFRSPRLIYAGNAGPAQNLTQNLSLLSEFLKIESMSAELHIYTDAEFDFTHLTSSYLKIKQFPPFENHFTAKTYAQYDFGLVSLNTRLLTNNIPGKYVSYIAYGLPVISFSSSQIDLFNEIKSAQTGVALSGDDNSEFAKLKDIYSNYEMTAKRVRTFYKSHYASNIILPNIKAIIEHA